MYTNLGGHLESFKVKRPDYCVGPEVARFSATTYSSILHETMSFPAPSARLGENVVPVGIQLLNTAHLPSLRGWHDSMNER